MGQPERPFRECVLVSDCPDPKARGFPFECDQSTCVACGKAVWVTRDPLVALDLDPWCRACLAVKQRRLSDSGTAILCLDTWSGALEIIPPTNQEAN